jgi:hypothetical protein
VQKKIYNGGTFIQLLGENFPRKYTGMRQLAGAHQRVLGLVEVLENTQMRRAIIDSQKPAERGLSEEEAMKLAIEQSLLEQRGKSNNFEQVVEKKGEIIGKRKRKVRICNPSGRFMTQEVSEIETVENLLKKIATSTGYEGCYLVSKYKGGVKRPAMGAKLWDLMPSAGQNIFYLEQIES